MKKFLAALAAAGLVALISTTAFAQTNHWVEDQLHFKRILGPGVVADSATISFCGANGTDGATAGWEIDTTAAISVTELKPPYTLPMTQTTPDSVLLAVLHLCPIRTADTAPSGDSVFVYLQVSNDDGGSWHTVQALWAATKVIGTQSDSGWVVLESITPEVYSVPLKVKVASAATGQDWNSQTVGSAITNEDIFAWRSIRFIVRANGMLGRYYAILNHWSNNPTGITRR